MSEDMKEALGRIFSADSELYRGRGFMHRIGAGARPAARRHSKG